MMEKEQIQEELDMKEAMDGADAAAKKAATAKACHVLQHEFDTLLESGDMIDLRHITTNTKRFRQLMLIAIRQALRELRMRDAASGRTSESNPTLNLQFPPKQTRYM
jgi:hypothetical protein